MTSTIHELEDLSIHELELECEIGINPPLLQHAVCQVPITVFDLQESMSAKGLEGSTWVNLQAPSEITWNFPDTSGNPRNEDVVYPALISPTLFQHARYACPLHRAIRRCFWHAVCFSIKEQRKVRGPSTNAGLEVC
jgi:hypothetical protein